MTDVFDTSATLTSGRPAAATPEAMADRLQLAAIAVNRTRMPMVITDPRQSDNPIVLANQAFLDLTGYAADEVLGRNCRFLQGADSSLGVVAQLSAAIDDMREAIVELLNYKKDGSAFWNQLHISPIHDDEGRLLYFFASQDDITEFRKVQTLEATEHRLLKEVDHRASNVLAVVNGIVRLSRADDTARYAAAVQQRVQALAAAHTLLAERGWSEVPLDLVVGMQVDSVSPDRLAVDGPTVMVPALMVQPLALVIHELLFNAILHGSLSGPTGRLTVEWRPEPQSGGFELRWSETEGSPPASDRKPGFGTVTMRGMIEKQLRGHIHHEWSESGLVVTITIPALHEARADGAASA